MNHESLTETYQLSGFDDVATVPITYPIDICLMELNNVLYASCLHVEPLDNGNQTAFKIFKQVVSTKVAVINRKCCSIFLFLLLLTNIHVRLCHFALANSHHQFRSTITN